MKRWMAYLLVLALLLPLSARAECRLPGPADMDAGTEESILKNGQMESVPIMDAALSLLEEGNPFLARYNLLTGRNVQPPLQYGVPYLFGGQTPSHVFAKAPEYVVQKGWLNSLYYQADVFYLYGFDCVGFVKWAWDQVNCSAWRGVDAMMQDREAHLFDSAGKSMPAWEELAAQLRPGDTLILRHPGTHIALYAGTLRQYGYTQEEIPQLADYLDWPLVIHSTVNAAVARRFAQLIAREDSPDKYRLATVTDGGVCVSLLGVERQDAPLHVFEQKQPTDYFLLPDDTWLTVLPWSEVRQYCWVRPE